jgi:hypothetical protein
MRTKIKLQKRSSPTGKTMLRERDGTDIDCCRKSLITKALRAHFPAVLPACSVPLANEFENIYKKT